MSSTRPRSVLQVGCGSFGPSHLEAWRRLGLREALWVADPDPDARARAAACDIPAERIVADYRAVLPEVDVVDVVAATELHVEICLAAIAAGKDVFVEKPLTLVTAEARKLAAALERSNRVLQVGYYFRHHPLTWYAKERSQRGDLGELRYLSGNFSGFKRARRDVGCTANDAVHFLDLCNWLIGATPTLVFSVQRDHFGRGLEDLSLILLTYPNGALVKVETGYIQPGRQPDNVVPNALTTKAIEVCGSEGALEIDYQAERVTWHRVRHTLHDDGFWRPVFDDAIVPKLEPRGPVEVLMSAFTQFLGHVRHRTRPDADVDRAGVEIAVLYEAIMASARTRRPVSI
ncbi:MAG: Gfo/Idh/MocA family protein [Geminicoccaceae bacterium]